MRHIIFTRLGIGVARPSFFKQHVALLEAGLFRSMAAQTSQNFDWYVAVDKQIDADSKTHLEKMFSPHSNFHLLILDPLVVFRTVPRFTDLKIKLQADDTLALTRIDDDDALNISFIENLHSIINEHRNGTAPLSVAFGNGVEVYMDSRQYGHRFHPSTPVGLTIVSSGTDKLEIHAGNHKKIHLRMEELGGKHVAVETNEPMWAYARRDGSDSFNDPRRVLVELSKADDALENILQRCGISSQWMENVVQIQKNYPDFSSPIIGAPISDGQVLNRMQIKGEILRLIKEVKSNDKEGTRVHSALISAFYGI